MEREYYLDNASTTYVYPQVVDEIAKTMNNIYGNPSSLHKKGIQASDVVENSRKIIANYINCKPSEIIFTSGACEANSLAILGYMNASDTWFDRNLIVSPIEHKSIDMIAKKYNAVYDVHYAPIFDDGLIRFDKFEDMLDTMQLTNMKPFVSIQGANSEIGTIQDIKRISDIVHKYNGVYHCDATQLFPYKRIDVQELGIDMLSMSGQKIHAPKGIGFLYVREGIELEPLIYGSQEKGIRGGTENVPYIAGLAKAIQMLTLKIFKEKPNIFHVRNYMEHQLKKKINNCMINSDWSYCLPNNINISFKGIDAQDLITLLNMENIYVSSGSACNSGSTEPSYVLKAVNVPDDYIMGTIRITLPDDFEYVDADFIVSRISYYVNSLRMFGEK